MAIVWKIYDGTNTIDLTTAKGTAGWHAERWHANQIADIPGDGSIPPYIVETIPVVISAATDDAFATALQTFHTLQREAAQYWVDQQQTTPVWYHEQLPAETGERRALVKSLHLAISQETSALQAGNPTTAAGKKAILTIERHPYWERTTARIFPNTTPTAAAAVAYDYTGYGPVLQSNGGFEDPGEGNGDIWDAWTENASDGALANEVGVVRTGVDAMKATAGSSLDTYVYQAITVVANQDYILYGFSQGDGTYAGRYAIQDATHSTWINEFTSTGNATEAYVQFTQTFTTPSDCVAIRIYLGCPGTDTGVAYFDDIVVRLNTHDIVGDVPARINALSLCPVTGDRLTRFWMGIRSASKHGAAGVTNFVPVWELEDGGVNADDSVYVDTVAGASGGDCVRVDEEAGTPTIDWDDGDYHLVCWMNPTHAGYADTHDAFGRFLWLLRAQVDAATEWSVYIRDGYNTARNYHDPISISSTSWNTYEAAVSTLPPFDLQGITAPDLIHECQEFIYAKRISGTGDLYLDCLLPIPTDEGFLKIWSTYLETVYGATLGEGPHGHTQVIGTSDAGAGNEYGYDVNPYEFENFRLPPGDGRIICSYADTTESDVTDQVELADPVLWIPSSYTERWTGLRGAE